jgi:hypothetical protein
MRLKSNRAHCLTMKESKNDDVEDEISFGYSRLRVLVMLKQKMTKDDGTCSMQTYNSFYDTWEPTHGLHQ